VTPRRRQGAALIAGAALLYLLEAVGDLSFYWTPLLIGLTYLVAAALGGPRGSYWATAIVLTAWGAGVLLLHERTIDVSVQSGYLLAVGVGATVAALLDRGGYAVDALGVAATILLAGLVFALQPQADALSRASTYAALVAVVGLVRLLTPERGRGSARSGRRR
jgi:hypothetical protein